jgi:phage-related baseplate assembly protein
VNATVVVRPYAQLISANPAVANSDKVAIGVTVRSTVPTPVPPPTTYPILAMLAMTPGVMQYAFKDSALGPTKAKPFGAIGMDVSIGYSTTGALPVSDTTLQQRVTKSPNSFDTAGQTGKYLSFFARWVTRSGPAGQSQVGPWSTPIVVVVV